MPIWIGKDSTNLLEEDQGDHDIVISDFSIPISMDLPLSRESVKYLLR